MAPIVSNMICGLVLTVILSIYTTGTNAKYLLVDIQSDQQLSSDTIESPESPPQCHPFCDPPILKESQIMPKERTKTVGGKRQKFLFISFFCYIKFIWV